MTPTVHILENEYWQIGILPETGASVAFGRVKRHGEWRDLLRPTDPANYGNPSQCSSFVLIPWSNRIKDAKFRFHDKDYTLEVNNNEGSASHGDTRRRIWQVESAGTERISLHFDSTAHTKINFPWQFSANAEYWLDGRDFMTTLSLKNIDDEPFPGGFGHHPYFVRTDDVMLQLPFEYVYEMVKSIPSSAAVPVTPEVDFRTLRKLSDVPMLDHLYRGLQDDQPMRIVYPNWGIEVTINSDPIFEHLIAYAPAGQPYFAVEPVTNANDGFNLFERGIEGTGVFVLEPGEEQRGIVHLRVGSVG
jgi:aldose 1-epimerase